MSVSAPWSVAPSGANGSADVRSVPFRWCGRAARFLFGLYASAAPTLFRSLLLLGQPVLRRYLSGEHGGRPGVAGMLFTTRLARFLPGTMPSHPEHHQMTNMPFHRLRARLAPMAEAGMALTRGPRARRRA